MSNTTTTAKSAVTTTRSGFVATAKPLAVTLQGNAVTVDIKTFSTGSVGWYHAGKVTIDGVPCQVGITVTAIGSKVWPAA
jgi:hypothetical protein